MFQPQTERIEKLSKQYSPRIQEMEHMFHGRVNIYIDYANVKPWANRLRWHVDLKRLKQFLRSFDTIGDIKIYNGTLTSDAVSESFNEDLKNLGYSLITKPVKIMKKSIDVSSIASDSTDILKNFVRAPLLRKFTVETVEYLNRQLQLLNQQGIYELEDRKCNFDVEIGRDMLIDYERDSADTFVLWSGDSDFAGPIEQLLKDGKKVYLFATVRCVAYELNMLRPSGLAIYDIQKMRNFICWKKEIAEE
jgi:uncharacterized LabA/DUF88 family protein